MKIRKYFISTMLEDLYGRNCYPYHIQEGDEFWYFFHEGTDEYRKTHENWHKIKVTYVRSGCMFYVLTDAPHIPEQYCPISCFMTSQLIPAELDPVKDLNSIYGDLDLDTDAAKLKYHFDDSHTVVKNWPNEREVEISEDELYEKFGTTADYFQIKMLEVKED